MLTEIRCDVFRTRTVSFRSSLNVVLGDENATNSIGKSTLLMVVDFVFGGNSLLSHNTDLVTELGHHDYFFTFRFDDTEHRFRRGTHEPAVVYVCDEQYQPSRAIGIEEFTAFLRHAYRLTDPDLSFRALVGLYLRVWGKENLSVDRPLHTTQVQAGRDCVDNLLKAFGRFDTIRKLSAQLAVVEAEGKALTAATRHGIVDRIGKTEYTKNQRSIAAITRELIDIRSNLARYATNLSEVVSREVLELKVEKDRLIALRLDNEARLSRVRKNLMDRSRVRSASFAELVRFVPAIDQERLTRVEEFHTGVAKVLHSELRESERDLQEQLGRIESAIDEINGQMAATLNKVEEPGVLVDRVVDLATNLKDVRETNIRFEAESRLRSSIKDFKVLLSQEKEQVVRFVEKVVNDGMQRVVSTVFGAERKSPRLALRESGYTFEVFEDTGTGTAYASLIVLDLTVFLATELPVVAHDSLLFKNIENDSVAGLMQVYLTTEKQSFVAIDEIEKYGPNAASLLRQRSVIQLDDQHVLYVKDWRT